MSDENILLIDNANIDFKAISIEKIIIAFICSMPQQYTTQRYILVRIYGGWNENGVLCDDRFETLNFYLSNEQRY